MRAFILLMTCLSASAAQSAQLELTGDWTAVEAKAWAPRFEALLPEAGSLRVEFDEAVICLGPESEAACTHFDWTGGLPGLHRAVVELLGDEAPLL